MNWSLWLALAFFIVGIVAGAFFSRRGNETADGAIGSAFAAIFLGGASEFLAVVFLVIGLIMKFV